MSAPIIELTADHLKQMGFSTQMISVWLSPLHDACVKFQINTGLRLSAFFANCLHESGNFTVFTENLNYSASRLVAVFPKYFPSIASTSGYAGNPQAIANRVYGGRMGNGIESTGDGYLFRGRGIIQLTGRANYKDASRGIGVDVLNNPDNILQPTNSALAAAWFFSKKGCNYYADGDDINDVRKKVNGGNNGLADVVNKYNNCKIIFGVKAGDIDPNAFSRRPTPSAKHGSFNETSGSSSRSGYKLSGANPKYPWNWVWETRSHHLFEVDDTPGAERLNFAHRTGSYSSINPDGTRIDKSVQDWYHFVSGDQYVSVSGDEMKNVDGQHFIQVGGDVVLKSGGDSYIDAAGKIQMNTPQVSVSESLISPDATFDTVTINEMIYGWIQNAQFASTAASLGGAPLDFDGTSTSSGGSGTPALSVPADNSQVTFNAPAVMSSPIQMTAGSSSAAPTNGNMAIAVMPDTANTGSGKSGYSLCYSVGGVWYRASDNSKLTN